MKVLHVIANIAPRYGGPSQAILGMTKSLVDRGHEVTIVTSNHDGDKELNVPIGIPIENEGVKIIYFPIQKPRFFGTSIPMMKFFKKKLKAFDIVHIHSLYLFHGAVTAYYCRKYNIPYIVRPHGTLDPVLYQRHRKRKAILEILFENRNLNNAAAIHYTTEEEKQLARPCVSHDRGFVVPNGIDINNYNYSVSLDDFYIKYPHVKNKKIILFFSRLNFKKGLDILIDSYTEVNRLSDNTHLMIVGPDNDGYGKKVKEWISERGLAEHVTFTGMVTGKEKIQVLKASTMFVLPSYSENFGISVIEAMLMKLPVIISNKVNIYRELLESDAGVVIECKVSDLTKSIMRLLVDKKYAARLSINGEKVVKEYYQWNEVGKSLELNYKKIVYKN